MPNHLPEPVRRTQPSGLPPLDVAPNSPHHQPFRASAPQPQPLSHAYEPLTVTSRSTPANTHASRTVPPISTGVNVTLVCQPSHSTTRTGSLGSAGPSNRAISFEQPLANQGTKRRRIAKPKEASKEKQRKAARQPLLAYAEQRSRRCLRCRLDPGNRGCFNYPVCDRCQVRASQHTSTSQSLNGYFVDWRFWLASCDRLINDITTSTSDKSSVSADVDKDDEHQNPIVLDFVFYDRYPQNEAVMPLTVILHPVEQTANVRSDLLDDDQPALRAPAIDLAQMDDIVKHAVWGDQLWNSNIAKLQADDEVLWTSIRLFIGYLSLVQNLATTFIQLTDLTMAQLSRRIATEIMYAIGFRLSMLYYKISLWYEQSMSSISPTTIPAVSLYGLEVLYRLVHSMRKIEWMAPDHSASQPLMDLQRHINERLDFVTEQIQSFECYISGRYEDEQKRQVRKTPQILEFARSQDSMCLPRHLVITASQSARASSERTPCSWCPHPAQNIIEILNQVPDDVLSFIQSSCRDRSLVTKFTVNENNEMAEFNPFEVRYTSDHHGSNDNSFDDVTKKTNLSQSNPFLSIETPSSEHIASYIPQLRPETPNNVGGTPPYGTALPSLIHSTPLSTASPTTPSALAVTKFMLYNSINNEDN